MRSKAMSLKAKIKNLEKQLLKYGLDHTKLVIRKNTASQLTQMKNDILNEGAYF